MHGIQVDRSTPDNFINSLGDCFPTTEEFQKLKDYFTSDQGWAEHRSIQHILIFAAEKGNMALAERVLDTYPQLATANDVISDDNEFYQPFEVHNIMRHHMEHGYTALHIAANHGNDEFIDFIISRCPGAELSNFLTETDHNGNTALHIAAQAGHLHIVEKLFPLLTDDQKNIKNTNGDTPLHFAFKIAPEEEHLPLFELYISNGIPVNSTNNCGETLLHLTEDPTVVSRLIEAGVPLDAQDDRGCTAIHKAIENLSTDKLNILLNTRPDVSILNTLNVHGNSVLDAANKEVELAEVEIEDYDVEVDDIAKLNANLSAAQANLNAIKSYLEANQTAQHWQSSSPALLSAPDGAGESKPTDTPTPT